MVLMAAHNATCKWLPEYVIKVAIVVKIAGKAQKASLSV